MPGPHSALIAIITRPHYNTIICAACEVNVMSGLARLPVQDKFVPCPLYKVLEI